MISHSRLLEVLEYDPIEGVFVRKATGKVAGSVMTGGYRRVRIDGCVYLCHRLAWLYVHGSEPENEVDHINGDTGDNRISNLRLATHLENSQNRIVRKNRSGHPGARWVPSRGKWCSRIRVGGKEIHIGLFDSPAEASAAYLAKKSELHPFFNMR